MKVVSFCKVTPVDIVCGVIVSFGVPPFSLIILQLHLSVIKNKTLEIIGKGVVSASYITRVQIRIKVFGDKIGPRAKGWVQTSPYEVDTFTQQILSAALLGDDFSNL